MEQTIRDGYQIMMNRAEKIGGGVGGKDYIRYRSNPQCSEGDGYGLLGAAAMADKETFDGMWLYIHDYTMNKVKRYSDCKDASPGYNYSRLPGWTGSGANSAADGDFDIALALLIAYLQWGEFMGIDDACGEPISYKKEAIEFLKALTDTLIYSANGNYLSGM
jgi:endo-1,4-beta-D-glucanase Y